MEQKVVVDDKSSNWVDVESCILQGTDLKPLLLLLYIYDWSKCNYYCFETFIIYINDLSKCNYYCFETFIIYINDLPKCNYYCFETFIIYINSLAKCNYYSLGIFIIQINDFPKSNILLEPLLFLQYINNLPKCTRKEIIIDPQNDLDKLKQSIDKQGMKFNPPEMPGEENQSIQSMIGNILQIMQPDAPAS